MLAQMTLVATTNIPRVYLDAHILKKGLVLADLPGIFTNHAFKSRKLGPYS
jgi:hypothetical protein